MLRVRRLYNSGEKLGAEMFMCGPLFTAEGGHGTQFAKFMPEAFQRLLPRRLRAHSENTRGSAPASGRAGRFSGSMPSKRCWKAASPGYPFNRLDVNVLEAVVAAAKAKNLPVSIHTGSAADVADAAKLGGNSVEHGSFLDEISDATLAEMKAKGVALDPTLSVAEGFKSFSRGDTTLLKRSLVQQVSPKDLIAGTERAAVDEKWKGLREGLTHYPMTVEQGGANVLKAWRAGVMLVTGSDAGNFLVLHGPTVQHEIELWVAAGVPIEVALQAATLNAAKLLQADSRFGSVEKGKEATLLLVDGNPLQDVKALSAISAVFMKGERVNRAELFKQK